MYSHIYILVAYSIQSVLKMCHCFRLCERGMLLSDFMKEFFEDRARSHHKQATPKDVWILTHTTSLQVSMHG